MVNIKINFISINKYYKVKKIKFKNTIYKHQKLTNT